MTPRNVALVVLVAVPIAMNAIALAPEVLYPIPNVNDDAEHLLIASRVAEALVTGENPLDPWVPQLELGYPQLNSYQPLAALAVAAVDRLLLGAVPLRTVFDAVRYLLLITFPLTVLWSMRTMGFTASAAAAGAAAASLLSGSFRYGLEYDSYVWRGFGLFTQLFGMHLGFVALALIERLIRTGRGVVAAAIACAALALGHLIYAYMTGIAALVLCLCGLRPANALGRLAAVSAIAALLTSFFLVPYFLQGAGYVNVSPYLDRSEYDSFGAPQILGWLASGDLFDHGRVPVLTALFAAGIVLTLVRRDALELRVAAVGAVMLVLYFGRPTLGPIADLLPMHDGLLLHRFIGGFEIAAIPLIGVGGAFLFERVAATVPPRATVTAGLALLVVLAPAFDERWAFYAQNRSWLQQTTQALDADTDARRILDRIATAGPGRAYAGLPANWGATLDFGIPFNSVRFYHLFAYRGIDAVAQPYRDASLNSDLLWDFNDQDLASYDLFNVDYVVAPHSVALPQAFAVLLDTPRYVLYAAPGSGYAKYVGIGRREHFVTRQALFDAERAFVRGGNFAPDAFVRFDYLDAGASALSPVSVAACPNGQIASERVQPARLDVVAECGSASAMVLKLTYYPNWHVAIDGQEVPTYMVSPSYLGFDVPAGRHAITAEYRALPAKGVLFWVALLALAAVAVWSFRSRLSGAGRAAGGRATAARDRFARRQASRAGRRR